MTRRDLFKLAAGIVAASWLPAREKLYKLRFRYSYDTHSWRSGAAIITDEWLDAHPDRPRVA